MMGRRRSKGQRGMTLVEAVVALLIMAVGLSALFAMITHVQEANRSMAFQTASLDVFARISAQIRDAQCDYPSETPGALAIGTTDPGLANVVGAGWQNAAQLGSVIELVGDLDGSTPQLPLTVPPLRVEYRVSLEAPPPPPAPLPDAPALDIDVRVREWTRDPAKDAANTGYWIREFPVKKVCNGRHDPIGRGEYR